MPTNARRRVLAVIGRGGSIPADMERTAEDVGRLTIDAGLRLATGGLDGVMAAASRGARSSARWREGDVVGVLPTDLHEHANEWIDIVIPTGLSMARNVVLVAMADAVIAIGGGSGTLSEIACAWQLGRPIVAISSHGGWAAELAGKVVDDRPGTLIEARDAASAVRLAADLV